MFLIVHDSFSGKALGPPKLIRYAVVAAGLAELVMQRRLAVDDGRVVMVGDWRGDGDEVHAVLAAAIGPGGRSITRSWVEETGDAVFAQVVRGLVADRVVRHEVRSGLLRRNPVSRFPAVDLLSAAGPRVQLEHMLRSPHDLDIVGSTFAAILDGLHLDGVLDGDVARAVVRRAAADAVKSLPSNIWDLLAAVTIAVEEVTLTFRRL
jgi:hypothetical protein